MQHTQLKPVFIDEKWLHYADFVAANAQHKKGQIIGEFDDFGDSVAF